MPFPYYGNHNHTPLPDVPFDLALPKPDDLTHPSKYLPDDGLVNAVNVALLLNQPLLVTGEPGTGKTDLAYSVSWQLGFKDPSPIKFETKSTSVARDLFYTYDNVGRFHAAQTKQGSQDSRAYITYNALGKAILLANKEEKVEKYFPVRRAVPKPEEFSDDGTPPEPPFVHGGQRRSVVLIDEIDKAPRDFPNDILNEIEHMYFKIPELENVEVRAEREWHPVVVLTSNSEKGLPDAFLRRCIFYHILPPDYDKLKEIVEARLNYKGSTVNEAVELFINLRGPNSLMVKKPATAEFLGWLAAIRWRAEHHQISDEKGILRKHVDKLVKPTLSVLVKNEADLKPAEAIVATWSK